MIKSIVRLSSLLIGVAILLTGHGLQLAYLPLRSQLNGWSSIQIGYLSSGYFVGFLLGCFLVPALDTRIGHIRCFATLTASLTAVLLALSLSDIFMFWFLLRVISGITIVGLYLIIESWLNEQVTNDFRGRVLSAYTAIVLSGLALGQLLLNVADPTGDRLFILAAMLVVLAAIPVCVTRSEQPTRIPGASFSPTLVINTSRAATSGSLTGGLILGSYYGLGPVYGLQSGMSVGAISAMMALGIGGGAVTQVPLGRLSDRLDRRVVILGIMLVGAVTCAFALLLPQSTVPFIMFIFGGCVMPIYALSLAHASDASENSNFLEIGTGLLLINAVGSILGPILTAWLMSSYGAGMFFAVQLCVLLAGAALMFFFIKTRGRQEVSTTFKPATSASAQGALELDPRTEISENRF